MKSLPTVAAAIVALALAAGVIVATRAHGIVFTGDSVSYLSAARSFADRGALRLPITTWSDREEEARLVQFPPLLPIVYGSIQRVAGVPPERAAPWLNALTLAATAALLFLLAPRTLTGVLCVSAYLIGRTCYPFHLVFWTEPLFLFFCAAICFAWRSIPPGSARLPVAIGVLAGLAALTRYAGIFLFPTSIVLLLADRAEPPRARLRRCLAFVATYAAVFGPWLVWAMVLHRRPAHVPPVLPGWTDLAIFDTVTRWVLPRRISLKSRIGIVAAAALFLAVRLARRWLAFEEPLAKNGHARAEAAALGYALAYVPFIYVVQRSFFPGVTSDDRILAPAALFLTASLVAGLAARPPSAWVRALAIAVALGVGAIGARQTAMAVERVARDGVVYRPVSSYTSPGWRGSETLQWVRTLGPDVTIFSNVPDAIALHVGRPAKYSPENVDFGRLPEFRRRLDECAPSVLILFDVQSRRFLELDEAKMAALDLPTPRRFADSRVYFFGAVEGPR